MKELFNDEEKFVEILLSKYVSQIPNPIEIAARNRIVLLESNNKI
jgi:hypothetical protein